MINSTSNNTVFSASKWLGKKKVTAKKKVGGGGGGGGWSGSPLNPPLIDAIYLTLTLTFYFWTEAKIQYNCLYKQITCLNRIYNKFDNN